MRPAALVLLLAGCAESSLTTGRPDIGIDVEDPAPGAGLCLVADPRTVVFDGEVLPDERVPATVQLTVPEGCIEPMARLESFDLDDPASAFAVDGLTEPIELQLGESVEVQLSLVAVEPGVYEGQLLVAGLDIFTGGLATVAVQLFAEIPAD